MKRIVIILTMIVIISSLTSCFLLPKNLTNKEDIINLYNENKDTFQEAVKERIYIKAKAISGIEEVFESTKDEYVDFLCGGYGIGSSTNYYGFLYSPNDDITAIWCSGPLDEMFEYEDGYRYEEKDGDNVYYVEKIDDHFFYYEAHF